MYKKMYSIFNKALDLEAFKHDALQIHEFEKSCSYNDFEKAVNYCVKELKNAGADDVRKIALKADGKTSYMDYIMPEAWDIEDATLEILDKSIPISKRLLADFKKNTLCIANRSAATPIEGLDAELIKWDSDAVNMADVKGKIVFTTEHPQKIYFEVANAGAHGIISSYSPAADECPGDTYWLNGMTRLAWYHVKEDKKIFCFSIPPSKGMFLSKLLKEGPVKVHAMVKSRIYDGKIFTVTGRIPGKSEKEICLLAHIYEPFIADDSAGAASLIAISRTINNLIDIGKIQPLKKSVRFIISMERYGFAQYFAHRKKVQKMLCGINMDSICHDTGMPLELRMAPASMPFFGDILLTDIMKECTPEIEYNEKAGNLSDDTLGSDVKLSVPTIWLWTPAGNLHHNSTPRYSGVNWKLARKVISLVSTYFLQLATSEKTDFEKISGKLDRYAPQRISGDHDKAAFLENWHNERLRSINKFSPGSFHGKLKNRNKKALTYDAASLSRAEKKAANIIVKRIGNNMPFSLDKVPYSERLRHPSDPCLHSVINWMDGKRTLYEIMRFIEFEHGKKYSDDEINELIEYFKYLAKYDYFKVIPKYRLVKADIIKGLRKLGIKKGDKIMLHSSLSSMGEVEDGPATMCQACMELLGKEGVLMMPSFNHYQALGKDGKGFYDPLTTPTTNGAIPDCFWRMQGVYRSLDPSHAFAVWGKDAAAYVKDHHNIPTMGYGSPLELLERSGGKVVLVDCPDANTFLHVVEMTNDVPCLGKRTEEYDVKLPGGKMVRCRTWGWRDGDCRVFEAQRHYDLMRRKSLIKEGQIGGAHVMVFNMSDFRKIYERLLHGKISGVAGCAGCPVKPRKVAATVPTDWNKNTKTAQ